MNTHLLIIASALVIVAVVTPALGSCQVIPLGSHNISLDFGGQNIAVIPMAPDYQDCTGILTYYIKMVDRSSNSSSFAYLIGHDSPRPIIDLETELDSIMSAMCDKISDQPYENGYISTGQDRLGSQALWGIIVPLDLTGDNFTTCVEIVASFKNGTLNEHIVKTARL
ncbi:MAG: hypothetical protein WB392_05530 [Methanotrichaceae archaeon]